MPHTDSTIYYDNIRISLNSNLINEFCENIYGEQKVWKVWSEEDEKKFNLYIEWIEEQYSIYLNKSMNYKKINSFKEWFLPNFDNYEFINEIEKLFENEEES